MIDITQENGRTTRNLRMALLISELRATTTKSTAAWSLSAMKSIGRRFGAAPPQKQ